MRCLTVMLAMLLAGPVAAQPIEGIYIGAGAGLRLPFSTKVTPYVPGLGGQFDFKQNPGIDTRFSVGYAIGNGWRFELEGNLGRSDVKNPGRVGFPAVAGGTLRGRGIMANALFDLDVGLPYAFPYFGVGAGYQSTRLDGFRVARTDKFYTFGADGESGGFAMQAIAGLALPVPYVPGLSVTADYRVMDVFGGHKFNGGSSFGPGSFKLHSQINQSVMVGVRYAFNTPKPAAADEPAPAMAKTQSYRVFFDLDKAALDDRARAVVKEAAQTATKGGTARIEVTGNADTSGGSPHNQALSERRARAVTAALIADGVPKDAISVRAVGDTQPAVATGPGVASREYRRVEVVLR